MMDKEEKTQMIEEAIELIIQAQHLVDSAISEETIETHYKAYGRYGFDRLLSNGNPYDEGLHSLLELL